MCLYMLHTSQKNKCSDAGGISFSLPLKSFHLKHSDLGARQWNQTSYNLNDSDFIFIFKNAKAMM